MELLDTLTISRGSEKRSLELWHGDLTELDPSQAVDILVVSARPGSYSPIPHTLIHALEQKGISLQSLAKDKMVDLRQTCSCWLSKPIHADCPGIQFKQILCFEPKYKDHPEDLVGDIFRSLVPFVCGHSPLQSVAMPLVSSGSVHRDPITMMDAVFQAAVEWLEHGLPLRQLKIVEFDRDKAVQLKGAFGILKKHYKADEESTQPMYDIFISYSHQNTEQMQFVVKELNHLCPGLRIFVDHMKLQPGMAWQQKLYQSIDSSRKVLALYSPPYLSSKACQEEYNIARVLHRQNRQGILFPIFLYSADLPPHMSEWQYEDCREADFEKLRVACKKLIQQLTN